jgi:hypothetical protein
MVGETLTHQKPLLYPLNYGAKPLFHRRLLCGHPAARKLMRLAGGLMRANAAILQKALQFSKSMNRRGSLCLSPAD